MKINKTIFKDLLILNGKKNIDTRGYLQEIYKEKTLKKKLKFDYITFSKKNVLRGLHFQYKNQQDKLVVVIKGCIIDYSLDLRKNSKTFGKIFKIKISDKNCKSIFIPKGFAHGFYSIGKENIILYKNSNYRNSKYEMGISILDTDLKIDLPKKKFIMSYKDKNNINFSIFKKNYKSL